MNRQLRIIVVITSLFIVGSFVVFKLFKKDVERKAGIKLVSLQADHSLDTLLFSVVLDKVQATFSKKPMILKSKKDKGGLHLNFDLGTPTLYKFYGYQPLSVPSYIYVTPGDSLSYRLEGQKITFKGKNEAHYNFFMSLNESTPFYSTYDVRVGIDQFKVNNSNIYQQRLEFLEHYMKNENVSPPFYNKVKEVLKFQYLNWMLNRNILPNGAIKDYSGYMDDINIEMFKRNDQEDNPYFNLTLDNYLYMVSEEKFEDIFSQEALQYRLRLIDENLERPTRDYALTKMISQFDANLRIENSSYLKMIVETYMNEIRDLTYKEVLGEIKGRLDIVNKKLMSSELGDELLLDRDGNNITLKEVLKEQGDKVKIIDFWASWCSPCIKEIKDSYEYREKLTQNKTLAFLYFSIDKDKENWLSKGKELKHFGMLKNQYLIVNSENSELRDFFNVSSVPYYTILDNNNEVFMFNAPSPNDTLEFNMVLEGMDKM